MVGFAWFPAVFSGDDCGGSGLGAVDWPVPSHGKCLALSGRSDLAADALDPCRNRCAHGRDVIRMREA